MSFPPTGARRPAWPRRRRLAPLGAAVLLLGGCAHPSFIDPSRSGPFFYPLNHTGDAVLPADLRRVVLLPIDPGSNTTPEMAAGLDPVLAAQVQLENRFEVVPLSRDECRRRFGTESFSSVAPLPPALLPALRRDFAADGVLLVDLTAYRAYQPLLLGLRAKLVALGSVRIVWAFDNVFPADDPKVSNSARHFYLDRSPEEAPADFTLAVLQSPARFATYAAHAMWITLPPILPPAPPAPAAPHPDNAR